MQDTKLKSKMSEYSQDKILLKKRIKDLTQSRDEWKAKSIAYKERADKLENDMRRISHRLSNLLENSVEDQLENQENI